MVYHHCLCHHQLYHHQLYHECYINWTLVSLPPTTCFTLSSPSLPLELLKLPSLLYHNLNQPCALEAWILTLHCRVWKQQRRLASIKPTIVERSPHVFAAFVYENTLKTKDCSTVTLVTLHVRVWLWGVSWIDTLAIQILTEWVTNIFLAFLSQCKYFLFTHYCNCIPDP